MKHTTKHLFWVFALLAALGFDILFWEKPGGINFFIFILLVILGGLIPLWVDKVRIPWLSYLLLAPTIFFSLMTAFRSEPYTNTLNGLIALSALTLFWLTLLNGGWMQYAIKDYLVEGVNFVFTGFAGGILFFKSLIHDKGQSASSNSDSPQVDSAPVTTSENPKKHHKVPSKLAPYFRGILIALPILAVLTLLLASADPVFNNRIRNLFSWFEMDNLGEYIFRLVYILILAYLLLSVYFFAATKSQQWQTPETPKPLLKPFLGTIEAGIVLGAINLLFLSFVILQFTYLFGGTGNITLEGFTYAEYARRGFFELLAVAILSLLLFYALSITTRRQTPRDRWVFSGLGLALVSLVGVILVSAFTRLTLYEAAYGFTRLRTLTHLFIIWTGVFLLVVAILEIVRKMERLPFVLILFIFGLGLTVNFLNVDAFIVRQNISQALNTASMEADSVDTAPLDTGYLFSLSYDSIPPMVAAFADPTIVGELHHQIGGVLACRLAALPTEREEPLISTHFSRAGALSLLAEQSEALGSYQVTYDDWDWFVVVNGEVQSCKGYDYYD